MKYTRTLLASSVLALSVVCQAAQAHPVKAPFNHLKLDHKTTTVSYALSAKRNLVCQVRGAETSWTAEVGAMSPAGGKVVISLQSGDANTLTVSQPKGTVAVENETSHHGKYDGTLACRYEKTKATDTAATTPDSSATASNDSDTATTGSDDSSTTTAGSDDSSASAVDTGTTGDNADTAAPSSIN